MFLDASGTSVKSSNKIADLTENRDSNTNFGYSVALLGDLNKDGVQDIVVGTPYYCTQDEDDDCSGPDEGSFFIFFLRTNGDVKSYQV